ncbi:MAG TPA: hypothetical protein ENI07_12965 [Desulfobacterales bacterium]|nr:hypothetical protein [Desulfobacterales bacterium]
MGKVVPITDPYGLEQVIDELVKAFKAGKILDIALIYRQRMSKDDPELSKDGRKIFSTSVFHWECDQFPYMVLGMIEKLKQFVLEDQEHEIIEEDEDD